MVDKKSIYTDDELIVRIWDKEEIRDLMSRRAFYCANEQRRRELNELWVSEPELMETASFGRNWGFYVGMDEISRYYVVKHDADRYAALEKYAEVDPNVVLEKENLGLGCMSIHPISTPRIVIAGDGKTARGLFYSIGQETVGHPDGTAEAMWFGEVLAADFVKQEDGWKIWHLYIGNDFFNPAGEPYSNQEIYLDPKDDWQNIEFGKPTIPMMVHDKMFNWSDGWPEIPMPYQTFNPKKSYGPEGHPGYRRYK